MDRKRIMIIFLIVFTNAVAATAILPMLPIYVEGQFLATSMQAVLVIAAYYAAQFVAAPWLVLLCQFQENRLSSSQKGGVPWMSIPVLTRCPSFRGS
jgi:hypothetical protein